MKSNHSVPDATRLQAELNTTRDFLKVGNYQRAMESATKTIQVAPDLRMAYLYRGYARFKTGLAAQSISDFNEAIRLQPADFQGYEYRAASYQSIKRFRKALADYNQALQLVPKDNLSAEAKLEKEMGLCLLSFGELEEAISALNRAIDINPSESNVYSARATAQLHLERLDDCLKDANQAIKLNPKNAEAFQVRSRAFARLSNFEASDADEKKARMLFGEELRSNQNLSR